MGKVLTKNEAMALLYKKFPKKVVRSCNEYSTGYVIEMVPKGKEKTDEKFFDAAWFVSKDGSIITVNKPGFVPKEEVKPAITLSDMFKEKMLNKRR